MKLSPIKQTPAMLAALERVRKLYPDKKSFITPGAVGNYNQYPKYLEPK